MGVPEASQPDKGEKGSIVVATTYRTMQEIVYETIREAILTGRYAPGQRLVADDVAKELGVSRMPVREALHRLEAIGLVRIAPHRGAVVSELSAKEIVDIYHIRAVLEGLAARLAAAHLTPADFQRMQALLDEMAIAATQRDVSSVLRANRDFHEVIWTAAGSPRLHELLENLYDASQRFRNISILLPGRLEQIIDEHRCIAQALAVGDIVAAERFANEHHRNTAQRLLRAVSEESQQKERQV
jgi:DNA-binding GntR family transcriptional regulator